MKLVIYKGFGEEFLSRLEGTPLVESSIIDKLNVIRFDKKTKKQLDIALISLEDDEKVWATYEEYTLIKNRVDDAIAEDGLDLIIYRNNLYPDYYPLAFQMSDELISEINSSINGERFDNTSEECQRYISVYNSIVSVEGKLFGSFYNYEYDKEEKLKVVDYYPSNAHISDGQISSDFDVFINEDAETYLRDLERIKTSKPKVIGVKSTEGIAANRIQASLQAYCIANKIELVHFNEKLPEDVEIEQELADIAKNDIGIKGFVDFRKIPFYKTPDINKEVVDVPQ